MHIGLCFNAALLEFWVAICGLVGRRVHRHTKPSTGPGAEVNIFAALAAKRPEVVTWCINAFTVAYWANHNFVKSV